MCYYLLYLLEEVVSPSAGGGWAARVHFLGMSMEERML